MKARVIGANTEKANSFPKLVIGVRCNSNDVWYVYGRGNKLNTEYAAILLRSTNKEEGLLKGNLCIENTRMFFDTLELSN